MTDQNPGSPAHEQPATPDAAAPHDAAQDGTQQAADAAAPAAPQQPAEEAAVAEKRDPDALPGVGPFTLREAILVGISALVLLLSFFSIYSFDYVPVWAASLDWVPTVGLPVAAGALLALRRLQPGQVKRVGSLSIDQFASVAYSVAAVVWLSTLGYGIAFASEVDGEGMSTTWVVWLQLLLTLAGVFFTVAAPHVAPFQEDFERRAEVPAHPVAREPRGVFTRPKPPKQPKPKREREQPAAPVGYAQPQEGAPQFGQQSYGQAPYGQQPYAQAPYGQSAAPVAGAVPPVAPQYGQQLPLDAPVAHPAPHGDDADATHQRPAAAPAAQQPAAPQPVAQEPVARETEQDDDITSLLFGGDDERTEATEVYPATEAAEAQPAADQGPARQAFWALVPEERDVVDAYGVPLFRIGPTAWALVVEDRGDTYIVRHDDGRIGYLHDTSGITRG